MAGPSALLGIASSQAQGKAKAAAANQNAYTNEVNAQQAEQQAQESERINSVRSTEFIGQQRAEYGAAGVSSASGSALDVLEQSARNAEMDSLNIQHAGQMKAWGFRQGESLDIMNAANAHVEANYGAANAIVQGTTQAINESTSGGMRKGS